MKKNTTPIEKQRIGYIDVIKGLCIILIVWGHGMLLDDTILLPRSRFYTYTFHVPLFFFLSGLFFKPYPFKQFLKKRINTLLIPFLFFFLLGGAFYMVRGLIAPYFIKSLPLYHFQWQELLYPFYAEKLFYFNGPVWFLLALFWCTLLYYPLSLIPKGWRMIAVCVISFVGYYLGKVEIVLPASLDSGMTAVVFYYLGALVQGQGILLPQKKDRYLFWLFLPVIPFVWYFGGGVEMFENSYDPSLMKAVTLFPVLTQPVFGYLMFVAVAMAATLSIFYLCKPISRLPLINFWGTYSLIVLGTHFILVTNLTKIMAKFSQHPVVISIGATFLVMLFMVVIIPILKRFFPYAVAEKPLLR